MRATIIRLPDVCARTGLAKQRIWEKAAAGTFPKPVPLGAKSRGWIESEIDDWVEACIRARDGQRRAEPEAT